MCIVLCWVGQISSALAGRTSKISEELGLRSERQSRGTTSRRCCRHWLERRDQKRRSCLHETLRHSQQEARGRNCNIFENLQVRAELLGTKHGRAGRRLISLPLYGIFSVRCPLDQRLQEHQQSARLARVLALSMGAARTSKEMALSLRTRRKVDADGRAAGGDGAAGQRSTIEHEYLLERKPTNQPRSDSGMLHPLPFYGNEGA